MKFCVTGANGFVGSKLCESLLKDGHTVIGLVRKSSDMTFLKNLKKLTVHVGDTTEKNTLTPAFEGCETVFHVAAFSSDWGPWDTFWKANVGAVKNVMETAVASGVKRVIHISSVSVYGFPGKTDVGEDTRFIPRPEDPYVTTKQEGERIALSFNGKGLEVVVLRPGGIYGPNDRTTSLKLLPELEKRNLPYVDKGKYIMAPIYIDNLIQAMMLAATSDKAPGQTYNVLDEGKVGWNTYFQWCCKELGCKPPRLSAPSWFAWPVACVIEKAAKIAKMKDPPITKFRIRAVMNHSHYSIQKAKDDLGYHPTVSTHEGIRRTVQWYREFVS